MKFLDLMAQKLQSFVKNNNYKKHQKHLQTSFSQDQVFCP
jgi:hypothetical protein